MRTISLNAVLESEIRVVSISRNHLRDTVTLEVDGETITLPVNGKIVSTLRGSYKREDESSACQSR
jgi:tRNA threonylcarbamoyladenosine modification (KEOPS) complex  Pcc1 subunit